VSEGEPRHHSQSPRHTAKLQTPNAAKPRETQLLPSLPLYISFFLFSFYLIIIHTYISSLTFTVKQLIIVTQLNPVLIKSGE